VNPVEHTEVLVYRLRIAFIASSNQCGYSSFRARFIDELQNLRPVWQNSYVNFRPPGKFGL
jgi:hypothetical protein